MSQIFNARMTGRGVASRSPAAAVPDPGYRPGHAISSSRPVDSGSVRYGAITRIGHNTYMSPTLYLGSHGASPVYDVNRTGPRRWSDTACNIFSGGRAGQVLHHHFSSEDDRMRAIADRRPTFYCQICKISHVTDTPIRRNVIFSSSTLINFWKDPAWVPVNHIDCEAIVGGTVEEGMQAFKLIYESNPTPINAVLCLGINNILKGMSVSSIVQDLVRFQTAIYNHSVHYKHIALGLEKNTVGICTIIRPPKCVTFHRKFDPPASDKLTEINFVNSKIKKINEKAGESVPALLNVMGIRTDKRGNMNHRLIGWREDEVGRKLHLSSNLKCTAAKKIVRYFERCPKC